MFDELDGRLEGDVVALVTVAHVLLLDGRHRLAPVHCFRLPNYHTVTQAALALCGENLLVAAETPSSRCKAAQSVLRVLVCAVPVVQGLCLRQARVLQPLQIIITNHHREQNRTEQCSAVQQIS